MKPVYAELNTLMNELSKEFVKVLSKEGHVGKPQYDDLLDRVEHIRNVLGTLSMDNKELVAQPGIIDKLGLGNRVIALRDAGNSPKQIASIIGVQAGQLVSTNEIIGWIQKCDSVSLLESPQASIGSVFDTQVVMQNIFEELYTHLQKVSKIKDEEVKNARTTKVQIELEVYKEIRALTKDAAGILESISAMERYKEFQRLIIESIGQVSPEVKHEIMRKLREQKALFSSLVPN